MIPSGKSSEVKLIDFGLSVDLSEEKEGKRGGTPGYIAPEILNSQSARVIINEKNDIFSIGCIFYRLLTGTKLFKGNSAKEIFEKNKECKINLQKPSLCHVSNLAKDLLSKLLEKDVQKRPGAVEALRHPFFDQDQESSLKELPNSKEDTNIPSTTQYNFDVSLIKESNVRSASRLSKIIDSKGTIYFHPHIPFDSLRPSSNHLEGGQKLPALSLNNFDLTPNSGTCYGGESSIGSFLYPSRPRLDESKPGHFSTPNSPIQNSSILNLKYELKQRGLNSHSKSPFKNTLSKKVLSQNATPVKLDLSSSNTPKIMLNGGFSEYLSHYSRERESKTPNQQILKPRRKLISIGEDRDGDSSVSSMTDSCDVNDS